MTDSLKVNISQHGYEYCGNLSPYTVVATGNIAVNITRMCVSIYSCEIKKEREIRICEGFRPVLQDIQTYNISESEA